MDNDWEGVSRVYDDLGVHGGMLIDREKLRMAFVLSGFICRMIFFERCNNWVDRPKYFCKVQFTKDSNWLIFWEVEQMMAYLLIHQELCEQSRWYEWYPLLSSLQSKLNTKKILTLEKCRIYNLLSRQNIIQGCVIVSVEMIHKKHFMLLLIVFFWNMFIGRIFVWMTWLDTLSWGKRDESNPQYIYWGFLGYKKSGPVLVDMVPDFMDFALEHLPVGIK